MPHQVCYWLRTENGKMKNEYSFIIQFAEATNRRRINRNHTCATCACVNTMCLRWLRLYYGFLWFAVKWFIEIKSKHHCGSSQWTWTSKWRIAWILSLYPSTAVSRAIFPHRSFALSLSFFFDLLSSLCRCQIHSQFRENKMFLAAWKSGAHLTINIFIIIISVSCKFHIHVRTIHCPIRKW